MGPAPDRTAELWATSAVPSLEAYIAIPNQSPAFDPDWAANGLLDEATEHVADWCRREGPPGLHVEVLRLPGRTPLIAMELAARAPADGTATDQVHAEPPTVLLYGHVDKQPPMLPWADGLDPYRPVVRDGRLYGRGGADDGYAAYASVLALRALEEQAIPHARCVVLIEASEESGSPDLLAYLDHLAERIGSPDLVVCLDSGCGAYEQLWVTTSLRGLVGGVLTVEVLTEGVHSGDGGGIVPDSFRLARALLDRVEDAAAGAVRLAAATVEVPEDRRVQAATAGAALGSNLVERFPWVSGAPLTVGPPATVPSTSDAPAAPEATPAGATPTGDTAAGDNSTDPADIVLARTWRPSLGVHGADGLPPVAQAGNVLRPSTSLRLSVRTPPTATADAVLDELTATLTADVPAGALVRFEPDVVGQGWNAPPLAPWLGEALDRAGRRHFGSPACFMGEGGTIPFMAMLGERFTDAQFFIAGVLGPQSNAHGPNEFLHLDYARRLIGAVTDVLADHGAPADPTQTGQRSPRMS